MSDRKASRPQVSLSLNQTLAGGHCFSGKTYSDPLRDLSIHHIRRSRGSNASNLESKAKSSIMSSTPATPASADTADRASSPPSSLPSAAQSDDDFDPNLEKEQAEEKRIREENRREEKKRKESVKDGDGADEKGDYMKDLEWFLKRSQGFSSTVMDQLKQALDARKQGMMAQPKLVSGGKMRDYQLEGLTWLTCLYQIGLNGILADEMGLGKTIQLISFLAFLRENGTNGPFLILGPLSTVNNWVKEFGFWTPKLPVVMYHGNPQVRGQIRRQQFKGDSKGEKFPIVCTSYEIAMKDKKYLSNYQWKFIVVVSLQAS